mmetsp:Transcript_5781/g.17047  ORF Transcript_5781/g.17047 Transcript_5781/m.17047 type:complete len:203 (+) Transcript_5781:2130-2738(+)
MRWPPPHVLSHCDQSPQSATAQSTGEPTPVVQAAVSFSTALQPFPEYRGCWVMPRLLYFWSYVDEHADQSDHSEIWQSLLSQSDGQTFVALSVPSQGFPHSLLGFATVRSRLQRPSQVGCDHSAQSPITQSSGTQVSAQVGFRSQERRSTTSPSQSFCSAAMARGSSGFTSLSPMPRERCSTPAPQVVEHVPDHSVQSFQTQ